MTEDQIAKGVEIAIKALFFYTVVNPESVGTPGDVRAAIRVLFGAEVDEALVRRFEGRADVSRGFTQ